MRYAGIEVGPQVAHLCVLEEVRTEEPPIRMAASFYEPGPAEQVALAVLGLGEVVVAIGAPASAPSEGRAVRVADAELQDRGVPPRPLLEPGRRLHAELAGLGAFRPEGEGRDGEVQEGAFAQGPVFETNVEGVFCALQERRMPARRHPLGVQRRIQELEEDRLVDEGGGLWFRRIEEIEAAAAALCAHRFAVGHARWVGEPDEGVVVLPGSGPLPRFSTDGVLPPVARLPLS